MLIRLLAKGKIGSARLATKNAKGGAE